MRTNNPTTLTRASARQRAPNHAKPRHLTPPNQKLQNEAKCQSVSHRAPAHL
jgi:hypothetical protein